MRNPAIISQQANTTVAPYTDFTSAHWDPDMGKMVPPNLANITQHSGLKQYCLAFIVTEQGKTCTSAWGGYPSYSVASGYGLSTIQALRKIGGDVILSFGGAIGTYLESSCESATDLSKEIQSVISAYNTTALDFDIEGANLENTANITKLAQALAALNATGKNLKISITLPVLPTGLTPAGINAYNIFKSAGLAPKVNIMAMDYGPKFNPDTMGKNAIDAIKATQTQLNIPLTQIAVTPMIGVNDVQPEFFSQKDAAQLREFCQQNNMEMRYWSINRDHSCNQKWASATCSGARQNGTLAQTQDYQFAKVFLGLSMLFAQAMQIPTASSSSPEEALGLLKLSVACIGIALAGFCSIALCIKLLSTARTSISTVGLFAGSNASNNDPERTPLNGSPSTTVPHPC